MPPYEKMWVDPPLALSTGMEPVFQPVKVSDFQACDRPSNVVVTQEISQWVRRIATKRATSQTAVVRSLLFEALYGLRTYGELLTYLRHNEQILDGLDIKRSRSRLTQVDLKHLGKANTPRTVLMPARMVDDLEMFAEVRGMQARGLLFTLLAEKSRADGWQAARNALGEPAK